MATTTTTFAPAGKSFPFIGIGVPAAQLITPIPSAEFVFSIILGAVTVAAAGESQLIAVTCELPRTFCYVLVDISAQYLAADANEWDDNLTVGLRDDLSSPDISIPIQLHSSDISRTTSKEVRTYTTDSPLPSKLIIPKNFDGLNAALDVSLFNPIIDGAAGTFTLFARFLRYDRNQSQFWQVNTPVLVR